jgi:thiamine pyrophosphate-dependent acetolactate synthase large subunit-like protein
MSKNVAELFVDTLTAVGVERVYGVSGDSLNGITDAIRRQTGMQWVHVRHEETAAFAAGIVDFGTDLENPNFAEMAEALGLFGVAAETPDQVRPALAKALEHDGPASVEVPVSRQELSMPPTITLEQMKGFSLLALRAVLSGRGDEIIDLAEVNLFR